MSAVYQTGFSDNQLSQLEDNTEVIEQREKEIQSIVQSISQINEMYKDLATMIVEQVRNRPEIEREGSVMVHIYNYIAAIYRV